VNDIKTISDLYLAGAHWIAEALSRVGRGFSAFVGRVRERFGDSMQAGVDVLRSFWNLTLQATRSAALLVSGAIPALNGIPLLPSLPSAQRFTVQGIVKVIAPELGEPGHPMQTVLPFQRESPDVPTLEEIANEIEQAVNDNPDQLDTGSPHGRKRRERARYIRDRGTPIEYDIAPLFIWRTS
jgi:hypothetical protein